MLKEETWSNAIWTKGPFLFRIAMQHYAIYYHNPVECMSKGETWSNVAWTKSNLCFIRIAMRHYAIYYSATPSNATTSTGTSRREYGVADYREIRSFQYRAAVFPHRLHSMGNKSWRECLPTYRRARSNLIWYVHRYAHTYAHGFVRRSRVRAGNMRRRDTVCQRRSGMNGGSSTGEERTNDTRRACLCAPGAKIPRCLLCYTRRYPNRVRLLSGCPLLTDSGEEHRLLRKTARSPSRTAFGRFANTNVCLRVVRFDLLNKQDAGDRSVASYESHALVYRANTRKYSARYFRWRPQTGGKLLRACFSCTHCRALSF